MRARSVSGGVTVQAIAGSNGVFLGFDLDQALLAGCLGFAIYRTDHTENEAYWLSGFKTFRSVVPAPDPTKMYLSDSYPIQSFWWGDYSAKPAHDYTYLVVPRYGAPGNLTSQDGVEATVSVSTSNPDVGTHGIYFNRGVAASQAYARKFGSKPDDLPEPQRTAAMAWLSRGLDEALLAFVGQAAGPGNALRAAVFEFTEPGVLAAFQAAHAAGADVKVVYHAKNDSTGQGNERAIAASGIDRAILIPRTHPSLAHNKFMVYATAAADGTLSPVSVWTGSTNMSVGGIFGHSNVGHAVRDPDIAGQYLPYWAQLATDPQGRDLRTWMGANNAFDIATVTTDGMHTVFSPRTGLAPLNWYAQEFAGTPQQAGHITLPFGLTTVFEQELEAYQGQSLHFLMLNAPDNNQAQWSNLPGVLVAVGSTGGPDELSTWAQETLTGFNPHVPYLHTKIILVDPLSADPTVISGSANFSPDSTDANDENMLVIRGNTDVADVYFTEYARIFQHFYARWWAAQIAKAQHAPDSGFLAEDATWQTSYLTDGNNKQRQRVLYASGVLGNLDDAAPAAPPATPAAPPAVPPAVRPGG
jgi:hypothetical protein